MEDCSHSLQNSCLLLVGKAHDMKRFDQTIPLIAVRYARDDVVAVSCVVEILRVLVIQEEVLFHLAVGAAQQLIEDMVVTLVGVETYNPRLLQQIPVNVCASDLSGAGEFDPNELSKTGRVVISYRLRVSKGFEYRVRT
jgi:hypothetical protein